MKQPLPKKIARRIFAIRLGATIVGGAVLVTLFALLALLYWMNATVPLINPAKILLGEKDPAWMIVRMPSGEEGRVVREDVLLAATRGMPEQAARLIGKGLRDAACEVNILSWRTGDGEKVMTVNLGKYPGQFRLVRRALERAVEQHLVPYAIKYHAGTPIFFTESAESSGLMPMALQGTVIIQASTVAGVERILDRVRVPHNVPLVLPGGNMAGGSLQAQGWPALAQVAGDFSREWGEMAGHMANELPVLDRFWRIQVDIDDRFVFLDFDAANPADAAQLAKELPEWIRRNPAIGSVSLAVDKVETRDAKVTVHLKLTRAPTTAPATPH